jgi:hypothetical protein
MSGKQINRANWTKERIAAFRRYLAGDTNTKFRGRKPNGEYYKKELSVETLVNYYKPLQFSVKKGEVYVLDNEFGARKILTDAQVRSQAIALYKHKETGLGKAPSIYHYMRTRYVNVSYKKVEQAIQSLASYQKYQARHVKKPKARQVIVSRSPGEQIDTDVMYFSTEYYRPSHNGGYDALCVVVDRFSGYIAVSPLLHGKEKKTAQIVGRKTSDMITANAFPSKPAGTIFHDNGVEYRGLFADLMRQIGYKDVVISRAAGAPSAHAERAVGIVRGLINNKLTSGGQIARKHTQKWWPLARTLVTGYNNNPMTDARAPKSPNQLKVLSGANAKAVAQAMDAAGAKRVAKTPSRIVEGARVSKVLKVLSVGDTVRWALEHVRKTGASKRPYPKQRWSDQTTVVAKVVKLRLGFAGYVLRGKARRRFEREDLLKVVVQPDEDG